MNTIATIQYNRALIMIAGIIVAYIELSKIVARRVTKPERDYLINQGIEFKTDHADCVDYNVVKGFELDYSEYENICLCDLELLQE